MDEQDIRAIVSRDLTAEEVDALAQWYAALSASVQRFESAELKNAEPPLRSTPQ